VWVTEKVGPCDPTTKYDAGGTPASKLLSQSTTRAYVRAVHELASYFGQPPDRLRSEHLRQFQAHLFRERKLNARTVVAVQCRAKRFFFVKTLKRHDRELSGRLRTSAGQVRFVSRDRGIPPVESYLSPVWSTQSITCKTAISPERAILCHKPTAQSQDCSECARCDSGGRLQSNPIPPQCGALQSITCKTAISPERTLCGRIR
jgi:hypothetical protein